MSKWLNYTGNIPKNRPVTARKMRNSMCSKADTIAGNRLLRCGHRRFFFTLKCHRPTSAQTAHEQRVDAESACPETATLWLGHQPGIGDAAGKPIPAGAGFGTVRCRQDFGRQSRRPVPAQPARQGQRNGPALPRQALARTGSADVVKFKTQGNFSGVGENNCHSNPAHKKRSPPAKP
jgi:hypothetical protein